MTITKRPKAKKPDEAPTVESFISAAPDATLKASEAAPRKGVMRGKREQISHTMPPGLLSRLDELSEAKGMTRAGLINLAVSEYIERQSRNLS